MKLLAIFVLLLTVSFVTAFNLRGLGNDSFQQQLFAPVMGENAAGQYARITNGQEAAPNQFKYLAALIIHRPNAPVGLCGGSLISSEWVLTAAHCIFKAEIIQVNLGGLLYNRREINYQRTKHDAIYHEQFQESTFIHDIGAIKIPEVKLIGSIETARLPTVGLSYPSYFGQPALFAGWGHTSDSSTDDSPTLRYSTFTVISNDDCAKTYTSRIYPGKMCTSSVGGISGCLGDSGGPLVLKTRNIQIGIASHGDRRGCQKGRPYAYTRVSYYLTWISRTTNVRV